MIEIGNFLRKFLFGEIYTPMCVKRPFRMGNFLPAKGREERKNKLIDIGSRWLFNG